MFFELRGIHLVDDGWLMEVSVVFRYKVPQCDANFQELPLFQNE